MGFCDRTPLLVYALSLLCLDGAERLERANGARSESPHSNEEPSPLIHNGRNSDEMSLIIAQYFMLRHVRVPVDTFW